MFRRGPSPSRATPRHLADGARRVPPSLNRPSGARPPAHVLQEEREARRRRIAVREARRQRAAAPAPRHRAPAKPVALVDDDTVEVPALARVHRSRIAFAVSVTLAALPVLVLDNLPATAEPNRASVEASSSSAGESWVSEPRARSFNQAAETSTTEATTTTTTAAPTTTEAPTTTAPEIQALQAVAPAPPPTSPPPTAPPTTAPRPYADPNDPVTWDRLAQCESSGNWAMNSGNGYYGGIQFSLASWQAVGGSGYPHQNTKAEQIRRGKILQARAGWDQWPACAKKLGYY